MGSFWVDLQGRKGIRKKKKCICTRAPSAVPDLATVRDWFRSEVLSFNCRSFLTVSFPSEGRASFHNSEITFRELENKSLDSPHPWHPEL